MTKPKKKFRSVRRPNRKFHGNRFTNQSSSFPNDKFDGASNRNNLPGNLQTPSTGPTSNSGKKFIVSNKGTHYPLWCETTYFVELGMCRGFFTKQGCRAINKR